MKRIDAIFTIGLILILFLAHLAHRSFFALETTTPFLNRAYLINGLLALMVWIGIRWATIKQRIQPAFIFLLGSAIKFLVFFLVFYPSTKINPEIKTHLFLCFFVPYSICLVWEVFFLAKWLNKIEIPTKK